MKSFFFELSIQKYEEGLAMKTGEIIIPILHPNQNREDEKTYVTATLGTTNGTIGEKLLPEKRDSTRLQKYFLLIHYHDGHVILIPLSHSDQNVATM